MLSRRLDQARDNGEWREAGGGELNRAGERKKKKGEMWKFTNTRALATTLSSLCLSALPRLSSRQRLTDLLNAPNSHPNNI